MSIADQLKAVFDSQGVEYKESDDYLVAQCQFHDDNNPSMSVRKRDGAYRCFSCGESGKVAELFEAMGARLQAEGEVDSIDFPVQKKAAVAKASVKTFDKLLDIYKPDDRAYDYLSGRGISRQTSEMFDIRYADKPPRIVMPIKSKSGRVAALAKRGIEEKVCHKTADSSAKKVLYGMHLIDQMPRVLLAVEGEIDAMSCWEAGVPAVALMSNTPTPEQAAEFAAAVYVVVILDADMSDNIKVKRRCQQMICDYVGCTILTFNAPGCKDANDILVKHGKRKLRNYLNRVVRNYV